MIHYNNDNAHRPTLFFGFFPVDQKINLVSPGFASWPKFCNIIFSFLLKIESVGPVDQ